MLVSKNRKLYENACFLAINISILNGW